MDNRFIEPDARYFAAANGFSGFRSYFNKIFSPEDYTRVYVLKGGPGTGKSSLMKRICTHFMENGNVCEAIYCSSDPSSLDGVIINNKNNKIGILDGTAPHETDAKIPGAIDEIVNLGVAWDSEELTKNKNELIILNRDKRMHYAKAYEYMSIAGEIFNKKFASVNTAFLKETFSRKMKSLFDFRNIECGRIKDCRLFSSFGKGGLYALDMRGFKAKRRISVIGDDISVYVFFDALFSLCNRYEFDIIRFPSPLSHRLTDGIYIYGSDTIIIKGGQLDEQINATDFIDKGCFDSCFDIYLGEYLKMLDFAANEFKSASEFHFKLEEIYTPFMNFAVVDEICENLINDIQKYMD